ncbi:hypothetical protein Leryth_004892 [Lithospermum erythrorhizon]|nr:hypothetical protein Leryth_004892 [Lithospermum erythrorhizon]
MDDLKSILNDVFGDSSSSDSDDVSQTTLGWEKTSQINGLWLCRHFLSPRQQSCLLTQIQKEGWFNESSCNQAMRFGDLPGWATELSSSIYEAILLSNLTDSAASGSDEGICLFPETLLWREPLFDQLIVNKYEPGEGICFHVDLMRFEDGIAIISLDSSCIMHFNQVRMGEENQEKSPPMNVPLYLTPGSLVLMWGDARYLWEHGIDRRPGVQMWEGQEIDQKRRISITLRRLCQNSTP